MNAVLPRPSAPQPVLDEAAFEVWLEAAHPGSRITFHRGHLSVDRAPRPDAADAEARAALNRLANRAMRASAQGLVHLFQKRHGEADFSYLAIRTRAPAKCRRDPSRLPNSWRTA